MRVSELRYKLGSGAADGRLSALYGAKTGIAVTRVKELLALFEARYGDRDGVGLFSAPGRVEIGGNHTDHNHGRVLASAVSLDALAVAAPSDTRRIRVQSVGHAENVVSMDTLAPRERERGTGDALVRGVAEYFALSGRPVGGYDAVTASDVATGSGLSSSAAFEVLNGVILDHLFGTGDVPPMLLAKAGKHAENTHFGKPCGLMDQAVSALGGIVTIDFADESAPRAERVDCDFAAFGHVLCVVGPIGSHADLTEDYAAIPREMRAVAAALGSETLRGVSENAFYAALPTLRAALSDRALLRAAHFFGDNARVESQVAALRAGNFAGFLELVRDSGRSSSLYLQNVHTQTEQGLALALMLSERLLAGTGASRVHGGGFAGTILAIVPRDRLDAYQSAMNAVFGTDATRVLTPRAEGGIRVL